MSHLVRLALLLGLIGVALVDWRPEIVRQASTTWLLNRLADAESNFTPAAKLELMHRLGAGDVAPADQAAVVRNLWATYALVDPAPVRGAPFDVLITLVPSTAPDSIEVPLPGDRSFGSIRWKIIAATLDGEPLATEASRPWAQVEARSVPSETAQSLTIPAGTARRGRGTLRYEIAFAYARPDGGIVGPVWRGQFAQPVVVSDTP